MQSLDTLWQGVEIMVQTTSYKALITQKLSNGWYMGNLLSDCTLGYTVATPILVSGSDAIWSAL